MVCVLAPLPFLPETVKNEAFGCWLVGTARMGLFWHFRMKVSSGKMRFLGVNFFHFFPVLTNAKREFSPYIGCVVFNNYTGGEVSPLVCMTEKEYNGYEELETSFCNHWSHNG